MQSFGVCRSFVGLVVACLAMAGTAWPDDLYKVVVRNPQDAVALMDAGVVPVLRISQGYLVLADLDAGKRLESLDLQTSLLASGVSIDQLVLERRPGAADRERYPLVFDENGLQVLRVDQSKGLFTPESVDLLPLSKLHPKIEYRRAKTFNDLVSFGDIDLDSLIDLVNRDSISSYLHTLESFMPRLTGTAQAYAARDWIADKFRALGYDSIIIDEFTGSQLWDYVPVTSYNVVAVKAGAYYPDRQIIVGGHFDAVPDCPGADDNGSGTAAVLEMARVLKDIETNMTFLFIAFDSEESWLWGSDHYADAAAARGDDIVYMQNLDMIGHINNSDRARLYNGTEAAYSELWIRLADSLVGIAGQLSGQTASDHLPFDQNGYDVTFVQEYNFSTNYHQPSDSTTYINFDYMTRMVKASLATVYAVDVAPPQVTVVSVRDVGDGQSLFVTWEPVASERVDHLIMYYGPDPDAPTDSLLIPADSVQYTVAGLTEGTTYFIRLIAVDTAGIHSVTYDLLPGTPYVKPLLPVGLAAKPALRGVHLWWERNNQELDFDHYQVIRDGMPLPDIIVDTSFLDQDPSLGSDLHDYLVVATDADGNVSDTTGAVHVTMKAATLAANHILAINRSGNNRSALVDETKTGALMREALNGYTYAYFSDTSGSNPRRVNLLDFVDYGLIIIGAEGARQDDIIISPYLGGILEDITDYLAIGGKAIIFGRWGDFSTAGGFDTIHYNPDEYAGGYCTYFHIQDRVRPLSYIRIADTTVVSDFVGAHPLLSDYPELVWDSAATRRHTGFPHYTGVPCPDFPILCLADYDIIYTYNSSSDSIFTEGRPVGWRYLGDDYQYVCFDIPLSFMEWPAAVAALQQAVSDLGVISSADDQTGLSTLPKRLELLQNHPNPFNPTTTIEFSLSGSRPEIATLEVFNVLGQQVRTLLDGPVPPGRHRVIWDGCNAEGRPVAGGVYFYRLKAAEQSQTRKMILLR